MRTLLFTLCGLLLSINTYALDLKPVGEKERQVVLKGLKSLLGNVDKVEVFQSELAGFVIIRLQGQGGERQVALMSADGKYLVNGSVINLDTRQAILAPIEYENTLQEVGKLEKENLVTFAAIGKPKASIWIFSDIDCGYCRKLHKEMGALNEGGITVHYISFPRSGPGTNSWKKGEAVWCSNNPQKAMNQAKQGGDFEQFGKRKKCNTSIFSQYEAGQKIGVNGTPAIVLPNGRVLPGYLPAPRLIEQVLQSL